MRTTSFVSVALLCLVACGGPAAPAASAPPGAVDPDNAGMSYSSSTDNFEFAVNSAAVTPAMEKMADALVDRIKANPAVVSVTCKAYSEKDDPKLAAKLSEDRMKAVQAYLTKKGVSAELLAKKSPVQGEMDEMPHMPNLPPRVEISVTVRQGQTASVPAPPPK